MLENLNNKQLEAVTSTEGPVLVLAGAGSGKTKVLTTRIAYLIQEKHIDPRNILAITFTNKAATEMKTRIFDLLSGYTRDLRVSTFHSLGVMLIRENYELLGYKSNFTILDSDDVLTLIKKIMKDNNIDDKAYNHKAIRSAISSAKNELISVEDYQKFAITDFEEKVLFVYRRYQERLKSGNSLDFDDLLILPIKLFRENIEVLNKYQELYQYILVDEYQDTNKAQYELIKKLSNKYRNIFVVGDGDQCLSSDTIVNTKEGNKKISEVKEDDLILSGTGKGESDYMNIDHISKKRYNGELIRITTLSGKKIELTKEHKVFFKLGEVESKYYIYLMYKKELGFRIGQTKSMRKDGCKISKNKNGIAVRLNGEHADKIWILKVCENKEEASYYEEYYSSRYGLPKIVFHVMGRKMTISQDKINQLYEELPTRENAMKLMEENGLFFDYPHHYAAVTKEKYNSRRVVNLCYFYGRKTSNRNYYSHRVSAYTSSRDTKEKLENMNYIVRKSKNDNYRIETERITYDEAANFFNPLLDSIIDTEVIEKINLDGKTPYRFMPVGSLKEGMLICIKDENTIKEDKVIKVETIKYDDYVYDLSLPLTRNYLANSVFVHNCIYAFRGANHKTILNFEKDFPNTKTILLEENYRSTKNILEVANQVIKNNKERKDKTLWTSKEEGELVKYHKSESEKDEAFFVINEIKDLINKGVEKSDIAILYRTNAQSRIMEEACLRENMPYKVVGSFYFYNRKEIKDLISYLKLIYNTSDDVSLLRVINTPKRGIGLKSVEQMTYNAVNNNSSIYDSIKEGKEYQFKLIIEEIKEQSENLSLTELIELILNKSGLKKELELEKTIESEIRIENLEEFKSVARGFEEKYGFISLGEFLENISLVSDKEEYKDNKDVITLMTVHSAKGLEYNYVFIIGMEETIFPHKNSLMDHEQIEEERRLFYVAMTRAKHKLYLINSRKRMLFGDIGYNAPSRFINEINEGNLDIDKNINIFEKPIFDKTSLIDETLDYKAGEKVIHESFGIGVIISIDKSIITVAFPHPAGIKKLIKGHATFRKV